MAYVRESQPDCPGGPALRDKSRAALVTGTSKPGSPLGDSLCARGSPKLFLRIGATLGGPAAQYRLHGERGRAGALADVRSSSICSVPNLIPGFQLTELAIHIDVPAAPAGQDCLPAGLCFIVPTALDRRAHRLAYVRWLPAAKQPGVLSGIDRSSWVGRKKGMVEALAGRAGVAGMVAWEWP